jgi:hypothetical protein
MKKKVGMWIDHSKAIVMAITDKGEETGLILSEAEKQPRRSGDSPLKGSYESLLVPADNSRQRTLTADLNIYYDKVIANVRDAESLLIFGPGEAKDQLMKRLEEKTPCTCAIRIETADKMTDGQIAAKIREYFAVQHASAVE